MRTIAVANQKGGCGKTTTSINLASSLAFLGKKVLLVDLDPQGHSSLGLGIHPEKLGNSLYDVLDESRQPPLTIRDVRISVSDFLHLVPSDIVLTAIEQKLAGMPDRENKLVQKLEGFDHEYDFVFIDCPPNLGLLTFNALRAARELIIPVECSTYALHGLTKIFETVHLLKDALNHRIQVHIVVNDFDARTRFSKGIQEELERLFPKQLFRTVIHHSVRLREAASAGQAIPQYDRNSVVFKDFLNLSAEIIERDPNPPAQSYSEEEIVIPETESLPTDFNAPEQEEGRGQQSMLFTIRAPLARSVQIAGDFNNWVPEALLPPIKEGGIWRKLFHLQAGAYKYKFIVDGEWTPDPQNSRTEPNPFGGVDSVIEIGMQEAFHGK